LNQRLGHGAGFHQRNDVALELVLIHSNQKIDNRSFCAAGVQIGNEVTNPNGQSSQPLRKGYCSRILPLQSAVCSVVA
jgi:hypothetical protein